MLPYLVSFKVNHNRLSGEIPHFVSTMLTEVDVSHNILSGINKFCEENDIPKKRQSDVSFPMEVFDASYNKLVGSIPDGIEEFTNLHHLDLSFNKVSFATRRR